MPTSLPSLIAKAWPPPLWRDLHVVVAVSGGADSTAMLLALNELKQQAGGPGCVSVAHFNHLLRGSQSDADADSVAQLAQSLGLEAIVGRPGNSDSPLHSEQAARNARYKFLLATAQDLGARFVATGHTADDQSETVLHRILRGASIQGLAGIRFTRALSPVVQVVRPILRATRRQVEQYLSDRQHPFRTDPTNSTSDFTRNLIRNEVLPSLRGRFGPQVDESLRRLGAQAGEAHEVIGALAAETAERAIVRHTSPDQLTIDPTCFNHRHPLVVREAMKLAWTNAGWPLQAMGSQEWQRLYAMAQDASLPAFDLPGGVSAHWHAGVVRLRRAPP